jgi:hypothetical protein
MASIPTITDNGFEKENVSETMDTLEKMVIRIGKQ